MFANRHYFSSDSQSRTLPLEEENNDENASNVQSSVETTDKAMTRKEDVPIVSKRQAIEKEELATKMVGYISVYIYIYIYIYINWFATLSILSYKLP